MTLLLDEPRDSPRPLDYSDMTEDQFARLIHLLPNGKAARYFRVLKAYATAHEMYTVLERLHRIQHIVQKLETR